MQLTPNYASGSLSAPRQTGYHARPQRSWTKAQRYLNTSQTAAGFRIAPPPSPGASSEHAFPPTRSPLQVAKAVSLRLQVPPQWQFVHIREPSCLTRSDSWHTDGEGLGMGSASAGCSPAPGLQKNGMLRLPCERTQLLYDMLFFATMSSTSPHCWAIARKWDAMGAMKWMFFNYICTLTTKWSVTYTTVEEFQC